MRRRWLRMLAAAAAPIVALVLPSAPAQATPGVLVFPGMEVRQGTNVCTLGYVDPANADRVHRGPLQGQWTGERQGRQRDRHSSAVPRQHAERRHRRHQPSDRRLGGDQPLTRRRGQQRPAGRTAAGRRSGHRARGRSAGVSLRRDHGGELRNHPGREQRLVHDGQRRGEPEGGLRRPGVQPHPRRQGGDRRDVQQHLGSVPGGGVVAGRQPTGSRRRHLRRCG